jgi:hypothetical protein
MVRRPAEAELLRAFDFGVLEYQRDASKPLGLVKDQPNRLNPRFSRAPAALFSRQQCRFDRKGFVFGCYFNRCNLLQIQPALLRKGRSLERRCKYSFTHNNRNFSAKNCRSLESGSSPPPASERMAQAARSMFMIGGGSCFSSMRPSLLTLASSELSSAPTSMPKPVQ